eukprot:PITA_24373
MKKRYPALPWILGGDFNIIKSLVEKKAGTRILGRDSIAFQNFITNMKLGYMETSNGIFTWNNKRGGPTKVASKLDKFMVSEELLLKGSNITALILPFGGLDYWPIQLEASLFGKPRNTLFRFENAWLTHSNFLTNIEQWWKEDLHLQGTKVFPLHCKLKHIKGRLKEWNKKEFGKIFKAKGEVEKKLKEINKILITEGYTDERKEMAESLQQEWDNRCLQEEILWRQKSRVQWIKKRERNTKFFHRATIAHRNNNKIVKLTDQHGIERNTHEEMVKVLLQHFQKIVEETSEDRYQFTKKFIQYIPKLVTREDNFNLNAPDILEVVEDSRRFKNVLKALNESFITLIPKQEKATSQDKFRPIALCNVIYTILSKVIANCLKPLLPTLVSEEQTGYVEGRQILDNIIQAHETVHSLITKKQEGMIMQLDIAKDYDKLR